MSESDRNAAFYVHSKTLFDLAQAGLHSADDFQAASTAVRELEAVLHPGKVEQEGKRKARYVRRITGCRRQIGDLERIIEFYRSDSALDLVKVQRDLAEKLLTHKIQVEVEKTVLGMGRFERLTKLLGIGR